MPNHSKDGSRCAWSELGINGVPARNLEPPSRDMDGLEILMCGPFV